MEDQAEAPVQNFTSRGYGIALMERESAPPVEVEVAHAIPGDRIRFELTRKKRSPKKGAFSKCLQPPRTGQSPAAPTPAPAAAAAGSRWPMRPSSARKKSGCGRPLNARSNRSFLENPWRYRNKMEFTFSQNRAGMRFLGLMIAQAEPYVFNVVRMPSGQRLVHRRFCGQRPHLVGDLRPESLPSSP